MAKFFTAAFSRLSGWLLLAPMSVPSPMLVQAAAPTPRPHPAPTPCPCLLPPMLYDLACIGKSALASLVFTHNMALRGLTRSGFLSTQMESAALIPGISAMAPSGAYRYRYKKRAKLFSVPGFCYLKLFSDEWILPALCTLGPYPAATDVARLSAYFSAAASNNVFGIYSVSHRGGMDVLHVQGMARRGSKTAESVLRGSSGVVGAAWRSMTSSNDPQHGPIHPVASGSRPPVPRYAAMPPTRPPPQYDQPSRPPPNGQDGCYFTMNPQPPPPRPSHANVVPLGPARQGPWGHSPAPYQNQQPRTRRSPEPIPRERRGGTWVKAVRNKLDEELDRWRAELSAWPSQFESAWNDLQSFVSSLSRERGFDLVACIPQVEDFFQVLVGKAKSAESAKVDQEQELVRLSNQLASVGRLIRELEKEMGNADPPLGKTRESITAELENARCAGVDLEAALQRLEESEPVPPASEFVGTVDGDEDPFASGWPFIPVKTDATPVVTMPWPEKNWDGLGAARSPPSGQTGKMPLQDLEFSMDVPVVSRFLLPRDMELYSLQEIQDALAADGRQWFQHFEDPCEPAKAWSWEEFSDVYNGPGFHFMVARLAQVGPQSEDTKLLALESRLDARWSCKIEIRVMDPRLDWMLVTIPEGSPSAVAEILDTAIIRLSAGNACYVVRHFGPISGLRDLDFVVKGSTASGVAVFEQLKARVQLFESEGTKLGWRPIGVRKVAGMFNYRGTFKLESPSTYWPWSHGFNHLHGSIPSRLPLINFEPAWEACKPYACAVCYCSDHSTKECPLPCLRFGGVAAVSNTLVMLVQSRRPVERLTRMARKPQLDGKWQTSATPAPAPASAPASAPAPAPLVHLSPVAEEPKPLCSSDIPQQSPDSAAVMSVVKFMQLKFDDNFAMADDFSVPALVDLVRGESADLVRSISAIVARGWVSSVTDAPCLAADFVDSLVPALSRFLPPASEPLPEPAPSSSSAAAGLAAAARQFNSSISQLETLFPTQSRTYLLGFLTDAGGSVELATARITSLFSDKISKLQAIFPGQSELYLLSVLLESNGEPALAAAHLASMAGAVPAPPAAPSVPASLPAAPPVPAAPSPACDYVPATMQLMSSAESSAPAIPSPVISTLAPLAAPALASPALDNNTVFLVEANAGLAGAHKGKGRAPRSPSPPTHPSTPSDWEATPPLAAPLVPAQALSMSSSLSTSATPVAELARHIKYIQGLFPKIAEELAIRALNNSNGNPVGAVAWLFGVADVNDVGQELQRAFPKAPQDTIKSVLQDNAANFEASFSALARLYPDAELWMDDKLFSEWSCTDMESDIPNYQARGDHALKFVMDWWISMASSKKLLLLPHLHGVWDTVLDTVLEVSEVPPRVNGFVRALADPKRVDQYQAALLALQSWPLYDKITTLVPAGDRAMFLEVLEHLLDFGLLAPVAAAWLVAHHTSSNKKRLQHSLDMWPHHREKVWHCRNLALHHWVSKVHGEPGSQLAVREDPSSGPVNSFGAFMPLSGLVQAELPFLRSPNRPTAAETVAERRVRSLRTHSSSGPSVVSGQLEPAKKRVPLLKGTKKTVSKKKK